MRVFVTGTDTGVGKTLVSSCLARAARARGSVLAVKPVASGVDGEFGDDALRLGAAAGHAPVVYAAFAAPLSPHRAAAAEGRTVPDDVCDRIARLEADAVIVEGVGGWRVPLRTGSKPLWVVDLARATSGFVAGPHPAGSVVVVAADRLGALNHTLLTVEAVRGAGLPVGGVVLNRGAGAPDPSDRSRATNARDLQELLDVPVAVVERVDPSDDAALARAGAALWRAIFGVGGPNGRPDERARGW